MKSSTKLISMYAVYQTFFTLSRHTQMLPVFVRCAAKPLSALSEVTLWNLNKIQKVSETRDKLFVLGTGLLKTFSR